MSANITAATKRSDSLRSMRYLAGGLLASAAGPHAGAERGALADRQHHRDGAGEGPTKIQLQKEAA